MSGEVTLGQVLAMLAAAVAVVVLFRQLRVTAVLGYLAAGVLIGPHGLGVVDVRRVEGVAELGVVFLLFAIGLELSWDRLRHLRRHVLGMGSLQVAATALALVLLLRLGGVPGAAAVVLGGGMALSSTAVVLRMLSERRELHTAFGRVSLSVLLMQDLAVVPLLSLVPLLGTPGESVAGALGSAFLRALVAFAVIGVGGRLLLRPVLRGVAAARVPELFTGVTLLVALGVGAVTARAGLSMALGAFLAGVLIAETEFKHQVEGDIEPFRGLLLGLFFMTVGMELDLPLLAARLPLVLALVAGLVATKVAVLAALGRAFALPPGTALRTGLTLAQGGEFGFVLFGLAAASGALDAETAAVAVLVTALSMALTPLLVAAGARVERRLAPARPAGADELAAEAAALSGHVVIGGFGRVGQTLGRLLEEQGVPYVALDGDAQLVRAARERGLPAFFGDAGRAEVLRAAGVARAAAVVVTLDDPPAAERAVASARREGGTVPVFARARDTRLGHRLDEAGATAVVPELVEGSLQLGETLLRAIGRPADAVERALRGFRADGYARLDDLVTPAGHSSRDAAS